MFKHDMTFNKLQGSMCHEAQPNKIIYIYYMYINRIWY